MYYASCRVSYIMHHFHFHASCIKKFHLPPKVVYTLTAGASCGVSEGTPTYGHQSKLGAPLHVILSRSMTLPGSLSRCPYFQLAYTNHQTPAESDTTLPCPGPSYVLFSPLLYLSQSFCSTGIFLLVYGPSTELALATP